MTKDELFDYINLQDKFQNKCEHICSLLSSVNNNYKYLSDFEIYGEEVHGEGDEYWSYGGHEHYSEKFPLKLFYSSDKEIKKYVEEELKKKLHAEEVERRRIQKIAQERQEKKDRQEYERLKKKFENGKAFFVKKKKEYPKTYEECCKILGIDNSVYLTSDGAGYWNDYELGLNYLIEHFRKLLICRDAYWKIAGEEMRLGKPWSPTDSDYITGRYCIFVHRGNIICDTPAQDCILTFPTAEMRDAFYEIFKELINECKELL